MSDTPDRKPRLVITRSLPPDVMARAKTDYDVRDNSDDHVMEAEDIVAACIEADALLCCPTERINAALIARLPARLRMIATYSAGYDHIDLDAARQRDIAVSNTPDVLTEATAEIAVLLILAALRRVREAQREIESGRWSRWGPTHLVAQGVQETHVGLVGMGRIARATAARLRPFRCRLAYWNRRPVDPGEIGGDVEFVSDLDALFARCTAVSLHVPGSADTRDLVDARRIALMPKGSVLINTARGTLVDDDAVIAALENGHLSGVGLDVFDNEPHFDRRYLNQPSAFLLPHIGSATVLAREAMGHCALDNLDAFFDGRALPNLVV